MSHLRAATRDTLTRRAPPTNFFCPAEVVELVDALASGASGRKLVGVRVPPSALVFLRPLTSSLRRRRHSAAHFPAAPPCRRPGGAPRSLRRDTRPRARPRGRCCRPAA